jgi:quercetin dioxygenase-like cupin family protein
MPLPGSGDDGNMTFDLARFDLTREIADSEQRKPWPSGIYSKTLYKRDDFRAVLICMESAARMQEHHVDGTTSVQVLRGVVRYSAQGQAYDLATGSLITVAASIKHEVESLEESAFLLTIAWPTGRELLTMQHRGYGT